MMININIEIVWENNELMVDVEQLLFLATDTFLTPERTVVERGKTTLCSIDYEGDTRRLVYGFLCSYYPDNDFAIKEMYVISHVNGKERREQVLNEGLSHYQFVDFMESRIRKSEYDRIAKEVHRIDRRERFINILMNIDCDNNEFREKVEYLLENPEDEFVEFVDDKLLEIITKTDEENIIKELIDTYSNKINCDR